MLVHGAALDRRVGPQRRQRLFQARRAVGDDQLRRPQSALDEIVEQRAPGDLAFSALLRIASSTFWPSARTPSATRSEIDVARLSRRTRTTVPSRISRTIGSSPSGRAFQASQSPFTLRQVRLTTSLPTGPANAAASARRIRRVLVPER